MAMTQWTLVVLSIFVPIVVANNDRILEFVANFNNLVTVNQNLGLALEQQAEANAAQTRIMAEQSAVIANYNSTVETLNTRLHEQRALTEENKNTNEVLNATVKAQVSTIERNQNMMEIFNRTIEEQKAEIEQLKADVQSLNQTEGGCVLSFVRNKRLSNTKWLCGKTV